MGWPGIEMTHDIDAFKDAVLMTEAEAIDLYFGNAEDYGPPVGVLERPHLTPRQTVETATYSGTCECGRPNAVFAAFYLEATKIKRCSCRRLVTCWPSMANFLETK